LSHNFPDRLADACRGSAERTAWLERLPETIRELQHRWSLSLARTLDHCEGTCAWVSAVVRRDGTPAVLKLGMPHMESEHELQGLQFWNGDAAVRVLEFDAGLNAMLLESCTPGVALRSLPESEQDVVIAGLLRRLWRRPVAPHPFRPLAAMLAQWSDETRAAVSSWPDTGLVEEGLRLFETLSRSSFDDVLLVTDLHAGNVLSAEREPWLVIDPKPFVGDRAYDATQHLLNCKDRLLTDPDRTIRRFADVLDVDPERVYAWTFARAAAEPREAWHDDTLILARQLK
jgi:streptomycin 6-kinase